MARMVSAERRVLFAADQSDWVQRRRVVEDVHATDGCGGGIPRAQTRTGAASDLPSERDSRGCAHPGVLPGLRDVEDAGALDGRGRIGGRPASALGRDRPIEEHGCDPGNRGRSPGPVALCESSRGRLGGPALSSRHSPAEPPAAAALAAADSHAARATDVVTQTAPKSLRSNKTDLTLANFG